MKKFFSLFLGLLVGLAILSGCDEKAPEVESGKVKVGVITVGPANDAGFNQSCADGCRYLQNQMPELVDVQLVENITESADVERVMEKLIKQGTKVIFATSFGYLDSALKVAAQYPEVVFMHCAGLKTAKNLSNYIAYAEEPQYLAGMAAASLTKNNRLGVVSAHPIPNIIRETNAFTLGAQSVNPGVKVHVVWTNSWYDPAVEAEATNSLIDIGCDVISAHLDSPISVIQTAEKRGVYSVGCHADGSKYGPLKWVTGHEWVWGKIMVETVRAVIDKKWTNAPIRGGLKDGYVKLAPFGPAVTAELADSINERSRKIISGETPVFFGPIYDQSGTLKLAAGKNADLSFIETMDWFVKGVSGSLPGK